MSREFHGRSRTKEYICWIDMKSRCLNKKHAFYKYYGGRGISISNDWVNSFISFYRDMGNCKEGLTIERIDNSKGYSKDNCKWATRKEQISNRRKNKLPKTNTNNTSGILGVGWHTSKKVWQVYYRDKYICRCKDFFEACCVRKSLESRCL